MRRLPPVQNYTHVYFAQHAATTLNACGNPVGGSGGGGVVIRAITLYNLQCNNVTRQAE